MVPDLVAVPEAARRLGITRGYAWRFVVDGRLPARKIGSFYVIDRADLEAFAAIPRPEGWKKGRSRKKTALGQERVDDVPLGG